MGAPAAGGGGTQGGGPDTAGTQQECGQGAGRKDRRRELERGACSSESEAQTYRPKGHPKMRGSGCPLPAPLERVRRTSGRGERGHSKRTL